jgi:hydroxymethylbilane synthase
MLGAPAQGALGISCRAEDAQTIAALKAMDHQPTRITAEAERELLQFLRGGCRAPVGARGFLEGEEGRQTLKLTGRVLSLDGRECLQDETSVPLPDLLSKKIFLGRALAERLLARGAARLIDAARERTPG